MKPSITIGGRNVGEKGQVLVMAEIGNNHDGKVSQAKQLIKSAHNAGCDVVKFQTHIVDEEMIDDGTTPPHFKEPRYQFVKRMSLNEGAHRTLKQYAERLNMTFISSPFSEAAVDLLDRLGVCAFKIGSGELTNIPFLHYVAKKKKPVLLSTGMSSWKEIDRAVDAVRKYNDKLILMQCTSKYPCPYEEVGLNLIPVMRKRYSCLVGISDHTPTIYTSIAAVAMGACIIEKHFTIDKTLYGPDHKASLAEEEMKELIEGVRAVEKALSPFDKNSLSEFHGVRNTFQKSIVAKAHIPARTRITKEMLCQKKPGTGVSPIYMDKIVGKIAKVDIIKNTQIRYDQIK